MSKVTVKIDPVVLASQVEEGMKKDALAAYYGLNISQMGAALKAQGLKIRKFHAPAFEFVSSVSEVSESKVSDVEEVNIESIAKEEVVNTSEESGVPVEEQSAEWK